MIVQVSPEGHAAEIGLGAEDVLVAFNGTPLVAARGSRDDPVDVIQRLLLELGCGDTVTLDFVRRGELKQVNFTVRDSRGR